MTAPEPVLTASSSWPSADGQSIQSAVDKPVFQTNASDPGQPVLSDLKILIIGGGMGGLSTALALSLRGFKDITVFESAPELTEVGAGINITPNLARLLDYFSVLDFLKEDAVQLTSANIYSNLISRQNLIWQNTECQSFN